MVQPPLIRSLQAGVGHADLERRFMDLIDDVRFGRWDAVDEQWPDLASDFEGHLAFEERDMFPRYCAGEPGHRGHVRRLLAEHEQMREQIAKLDEQLRSHRVTADAIGAFGDVLAAHSAREDRTVYAWLASRHVQD